MAQKVLKVGSSAAITLPKRALDALGVQIGDSVEVFEDAKSGVVRIESHGALTARDKHIARIGAGFIERYKKALKALADK